MKPAVLVKVDTRQFGTISVSTMDSNFDPIVVNEKEIDYAKIIRLHISCDLP